MNVPIKRGTARRLGIVRPLPPGVYWGAPAGHLTPEMAKVLFGGFTMAEAEEGTVRLVAAVRTAAGMDAAEQAILVRFHDKAGKPVFQEYDGGQT